MKNFIIIFILVICAKAQAQHARFINQGSIEFERKTNTYALIKKQIKDWDDDSFSNQAFEHYQKNNPQFKISKSKLIFNNEISAFIPEEEAISTTGGWFANMIELRQSNSVLTNLSTGTNTTQKKIYEETYLLTDSARKINWKITDEFRNIAGYNCRRANAIIMDSVYVVAFYTDEITVSSGPESFAGLPGMILGVALPHDHVTWFATSVTDSPISRDQVKIPTKGKPVNKQQLDAVLKSTFKNWGKSAQRNLKWLTL